MKKYQSEINEQFKSVANQEQLKSMVNKMTNSSEARHYFGINKNYWDSTNTK